MAKDAQGGNRHRGYSPGTTCWCAVGAVEAATGYAVIEPNTALAVRALERVMPRREGSVPSFNDAPTTTHADILALFDRAIAAEEAAP